MVADVVVTVIDKQVAEHHQQHHVFVAKFHGTDLAHKLQLAVAVKEFVNALHRAFKGQIVALAQSKDLLNLDKKLSAVHVSQVTRLKGHVITKRLHHLGRHSEGEITVAVTASDEPSTLQFLKIIDMPEQHHVATFQQLAQLAQRCFIVHATTLNEQRQHHTLLASDAHLL